MSPLLRAAGRGIQRRLGLLPRRPYGIAFLAVGFLIWGLLAGVAGIVDGVRAGLGRGGAAAMDALVQLLVAGVLLVASFGLWDMRRWAWVLALLVAGVSFAATLGSLFWMLVWGIVLVYLVSVYASFEPLMKRVRRAMT